MLRKEISECCAIPPFYGVAYQVMAAQKNVCYPIGLNIIIGILHTLWLELRKPWFREREYAIWKEADDYKRYQMWQDNCQAAYQEGYEAAMKDKQGQADHGVIV